jgi:hypothetical protein
VRGASAGHVLIGATIGGTGVGAGLGLLVHAPLTLGLVGFFAGSVGGIVAVARVYRDL